MQPHGVYVAALTPMRGRGELDLDAIGPHVDRMVAEGADGVVSLGSTGEFMDLEPGERRDVIAETVSVVAGRVPVLAGLGGVGTTEACANAAIAADAGADGLLALPPLYWKLGDSGLRRHFLAIAAATELPWMLYDFPHLAGTDVAPATIAALAEASPTFVGTKLSGPELRKAHAVVARTREHRPGFSVMMGPPELLLPGLVAGVSGTIAGLANVTCEPLVEIVAAYRAGDLDAAERQHRHVLAMCAMYGMGNPQILAMKAGARVHGSPMEPVVRTLPDDPDDVVARATALATELRTVAPAPSRAAAG